MSNDFLGLNYVCEKCGHKSRPQTSKLTVADGRECEICRVLGKSCPYKPAGKTPPQRSSRLQLMNKNYSVPKIKINQPLANISEELTPHKEIRRSTSRIMYVPIEQKVVYYTPVLV